jgi:predicted DNA-binding transcriptional regulator AlpA
LESAPDIERRREVVARLFEPNGKPRAGLKDAPPLRSADVAALFRMSERAIRLWAAKGELPHMRTLGGGRLLYPADEIAALYAQHYPDTRARGRSRARAAAGRTRRRAS